ncbi:MAG TPA: SpoIIE family protein phosphatase [Solirubrobacteraceae bacterium]|nr:SpoIIE family protein phosphatase [Solirubrobacteraceae bacterium]
MPRPGAGARTTVDHAALFDAAPSPFLVVDPQLVIVEVNRAYCASVGRSREELLGRFIFEAFPDNPDDLAGDGVANLRASLERARDTRRPDTMAVQKYDIPDPASGGFVERYWSPMNVPVAGVDGRTAFIVHRVEDVTDYVRQQAARRVDVARGEEWRRRVLEVEADLVARARELQALNAQLREAGEREREVALALQRAMLPAPDPCLDGLDVAVRYRPAENALFVGGDWFDVVELAEDAVALAVGDVVGKGLPAAAVMGQLRSALSAATHGADGPAEALDTLDRYARTVDGAPGTTVVQVRLDRARETIRYSRAGHLPPLLVTAAGEATFLEEGGGLPLGVDDPGEPRPEAEVALPRGATLVLYTDGLIERRGRPLDDGFAALAQTVGRHVALGVEALADAILDELRDDGAMPDDTALVVARSTG